MQNNHMLYTHYICECMYFLELYEGQNTFLNALKIHIYIIKMHIQKIQKKAKKILAENIFALIYFEPYFRNYIFLVIFFVYFKIDLKIDLFCRMGHYCCVTQ